MSKKYISKFELFFKEMSAVVNEDGDLVMQDPLDQEAAIITGNPDDDEDVDDDDMTEVKLVTSVDKPNEFRKEMETCFGFDDVIS